MPAGVFFISSKILQSEILSGQEIKKEATNEVICVGFPDVRGPVLQLGSCKTQHIAWTLDLDRGAPNTVTRQPC